jgi:L-asparaginase II
MHVEIAARMLEKIGLSESDLQCGSHLPFSEKQSERLLRANAEITQLHNNCSGKHAGMLATAKHIGSDIRSYLSLKHPLQEQILLTIAKYCEISVNEIEIGIDGCCAPNFAMPLSAMARGFLNLIAPKDDFADEAVRSASARIVSAMVKFPELIGGSERLDTILMKAAPGTFISKVGADGVWLCGILPSDKYPKGAAIAMKIEDGDDKRGRPVVSIELLRRLGILPAEALEDFSPMPIKNRRGDEVGRIEAGAVQIEN